MLIGSSNKRGQSLGLSVITAIMIFVVGMLAFNFIRDDITLARSVDGGLDCSNVTGISDGTKLTCLTVDLVLPVAIIGLLSIAGFYITSRFVF